MISAVAEDVVALVAIEVTVRADIGDVTLERVRKGDHLATLPPISVAALDVVLVAEALLRPKRLRSVQGIQSSNTVAYSIEWKLSPLDRLSK